jgi:F-type H+-transporting ATPase subunit epsilon
MADKTLQCTIVTPERAVLDAKADFVVLPMEDGELGVLAGHTPLLGKLGKGEVRLTTGGTVRKIGVDGGFAQVRANVISILTPRAKLDV